MLHRHRYPTATATASASHHHQQHRPPPQVLRETEATAGLADLREGDLLQLDLSRLAAEKGGRLSIISNTPFYLTSALLFKMLGALDEVDLVRARVRV